MSNGNDLLFIDTSGFKAIIDTKDEFHKQATTIWKKIQTESSILITSNYILDESFTLIRTRCDIKTVGTFRSIIAENSSLIKVVRVAIDDEARAWSWFQKDWSKLSFTDCVSFAMMQRLGIQRVLSFDMHFKRAGFTLVK